MSKNKLIIFSLVLFIILCFSIFCFADTITLKSGVVLKGQTQKRSDGLIVVYLDNGSFAVVPPDLIVSIVNSSSENQLKEKSLNRLENETETNEQLVYSEEDFDYTLKIPSGWCRIAEDNYPQFFHAYAEDLHRDDIAKKRQFPFRRIFWLIKQEDVDSFVSDYSFKLHTLPVIDVTSSYTPINTELTNPNKMILDAYGRMKQIIFIMRVCGFFMQSKCKFENSVIKNKSNEPILRTVITMSNDTEGETMMMVNYEYVHIINNGIPKFHIVMIGCACRLKDREKYFPVFGAFVKDFQIIEKTKSPQ